MTLALITKGLINDKPFITINKILCPEISMEIEDTINITVEIQGDFVI